MAWKKFGQGNRSQITSNINSTQKHLPNYMIQMYLTRSYSNFHLANRQEARRATPSFEGHIGLHPLQGARRHSFRRGAELAWGVCMMYKPRACIICALGVSSRHACYYEGPFMGLVGMRGARFGDIHHPGRLRPYNATDFVYFRASEASHWY